METPVFRKLRFCLRIFMLSTSYLPYFIAVILYNKEIATAIEINVTILSTWLFHTIAAVLRIFHT